MSGPARIERGPLTRGWTDAAGAALRVLMVDGSQMAIRLLKQSLTDVGLEVLAVHTLQDAYTTVRTTKIDAILVELVVAGQSGLEMITFLMGKGDLIPVLVLTANVEEAARHDALQKGAAAVLLKSVPVEELEAAIRIAVAKVSKSPPRLLIVDDDPFVRTLLRATFQDEGFEVLEASGALEAWELIHRHRVHLIVCDLYMGEYSGLDLMRNMRSHKVSTPVIVLTGRPNEESLRQARIYGAVAVLVKSSDLDPLKGTVRQVLENLELVPRPSAC